MYLKNQWCQQQLTTAIFWRPKRDYRERVELPISISYKLGSQTFAVNFKKSNIHICMEYYIYINHLQLSPQGSFHIHRNGNSCFPSASHKAWDGRKSNDFNASHVSDYDVSRPGKCVIKTREMPRGTDLVLKILSLTPWNFSKSNFLVI